jgi:murein DD-endopeptidase MepM/ murein hydrolase activator NlpD
MTQLETATAGFLRNRDLFVHDGTRLRRIRLSVPLQTAFFALVVSLIAWSGYAAARLVAPAAAVTVSGDLASLAAATEARAQQIEQRQAVLAAMLAGEHVDHGLIDAEAATTTIPGALAARLARAEATQEVQAVAAARALDARYQTAASELRKLGLNPARFTGTGGPFEAVRKADPTFKALFQSWKKLDNLQDGAIAVPSDKPVKTAAFTSGYGVRSDPFQGRAAMHSGIDLSGPVGTPIYATADGFVTAAEYNSGGYGNLIKLSHGRGIETRYGHLSAMTVRSGQQVKRGDLIGRMGSTGRSTGSHLHYEVRVDGRAVNPIPFMKSTDYLIAMQRKAGSASMDQVALGGPAGAARK